MRRKYVFLILLNYFLVPVIQTASLPQSVEHGVELFPLSIIHVNDFHARFEETNEQATECLTGEKCIGGYARAVTIVKELQSVRNNTNPIYLNVGDNFQGTIWYTMGKWRVTSHFLNLLKADAMTVGNHEFDYGVDGVVPFLETIQTPVVVANIDDTDEPTFQNKYKKSIIIDRYGRKVGIIGAIIHSTNELANTDKLKFLNESVAIKGEIEKLKADAVDIIILLSHCGIVVDYEIARDVGSDIDVIVGGHSHTFMYTGIHPPGPDPPMDQYPAVFRHRNGKKTLIVQASAFLKYIGDLTVYFDEQGNVNSWEGAPIYLDTNIKPDEEVLRELQRWKEEIEQEGLKEVGYLTERLTKLKCNLNECNLGNLVADAFVHYYATKIPSPKDQWTSAAIALVPAGGLRAPLEKGVVTFGDIVTLIPFANSVDSLELRGDHLKELLEYSISKRNPCMIQVSGLKVVYNITREIGDRVLSIKVLGTKLNSTVYEPLDLTKKYRIIVPSFIINGGDGFKIIPQYMEEHRLGPIDVDMVIEYLKERHIVFGKNRRITILT